MSRLRSLPRLLRNLLAHGAGSAVNTLVFFFLTPFVIAQLGAELYALWVLVHSLGFYLAYLDLGMRSALVKYAAEASAGSGAQAERRLERLAGTALVVFACTGAGALALCAAGAYWLAPLLELPPDRLAALRGALLLLGAEVWVRFLALVPGGLLEGAQRYGVLNRVQIGLVLGRAALSVALLLAGFGLLALVAAELAASLASLFLRSAYVRRALPGFSLWPPRFDRATWREIRGYGLWTLLNDAALRGSADLDKLFIPAFLSVALLTPYTVAVSIAAVAFRAIAPCIDVLFPFSSALGARGDRQGLDALLVRASKASLALATPFAIFVLLAGESLVRNWVGAAYTADAAPLLYWIVPGTLLSALIMPAVIITTALGRVREIFYFTLLEAALTALLIGASVRSYGLPGVAASCLAAAALAELGGVLPLALRTVGVSAGRYAREVLGGALLPALPVLALGALLVRLWYPQDWLWLGLQGVALVLTYAGTFAWLSVSKRERSELLGWAQRLAAGSAS